MFWLKLVQLTCQSDRFNKTGLATHGMLGIALHKTTTQSLFLVGPVYETDKPGICQSENGYGSELCIVLLVGQSSRGGLVTRTSWAACPDISSALASGEFLVLLLIACKLVGGMLADISTQVLHLDGLENALAMTQ